MRPTDRVMRYLTAPALDRIRMPGHILCDLTQDLPMKSFGDYIPPPRLGIPFHYCGAWCIDVPANASSLKEFAGRLVKAMPPDEPLQRVLLLADRRCRARYRGELEQLSDFDIGEREEMLLALRNGRDRAKRYRLTPLTCFSPDSIGIEETKM